MRSRCLGRESIRAAFRAIFRAAFNATGCRLVSGIAHDPLRFRVASSVFFRLLYLFRTRVVCGFRVLTQAADGPMLGPAAADMCTDAVPAGCNPAACGDIIRLLGCYMGGDYGRRSKA